MEKKDDTGCLESLGGLVVIGLIIWFIFPLFCDGSGNEPTKREPEWYRPEAFSVAETFVKRQLKSPGSAKFPTSSSERRNSVRVYPDGESYKIDSWVDSENTFGGLVRVYFTCTIKRIDRANDFPEWELVDIELLE